MQLYTCACAVTLNQLSAANLPHLACTAVHTVVLDITGQAVDAAATAAV